MSSTTSTVSTPASSSRSSDRSTGQGMPRRTSRSPSVSSASAFRPRSSSARRTAENAAPAARIAVRARGGAWTTRLRPAARAYSRARSRRAPMRSCSASRFVGGRRTGGAPAARTGKVGIPARAAARSTVAVASATSATILSPVQAPEWRERATACSAKERSSGTVPGASSGTRRLRQVGSQALGTVEDLLDGSSPIQATAPPSGAVPLRFAWRMASIARSSPGLLPYQIPVTPSYRRPPSSPSSWVPPTAVAPSSSLTAGRTTTPAGSRCSAARANSRSRPARGEPWYPLTNRPVRRSRASSARRCSRVLRTRAWIPVSSATSGPSR